MYPDNNSIMNAVGGVGQQPQATSMQAPMTMPNASNTMNQTTDPNSMGQPMFGSSPLDTNPNYARTIMDFFNNNPISGPAPFSMEPLQPGTQGRWNSLIPNDSSTMMQNIMQFLGAQ